MPEPREAPRQQPVPLDVVGPRLDRLGQKHRQPPGPGDDHRQRRLAKSGRPGQQNVIRCAAAILGTLQDQLQLPIHHYLEIDFLSFRDLVDALPDASVDRVLILFPDPWHKARHNKRRLLQDETAQAFARILKPGGTLRFVTDWRDYAEWALERLERNSGRHALMFLDLDQFKLINDTSGHMAGDQLLVQLSMTMQEQLRDHDVLARLGGDEFGLLFDTAGDEAAVMACDRVVAACGVSMKVLGHSVQGSASAGSSPRARMACAIRLT